MRRATTVAPQGSGGPAVSDGVLTVVALLFLIVVGFADAGEADDGLLAVLAVGSWAPLLVRRRWPRVVLGVVVIVEAVHVVLVPLATPVQFTSVPVATMLALYTVAVRRAAREAWTWGGATAALLLVLGTVAREGERLAANMFALDLVLAATGAGVVVRSRRLRLAAMQRRAEIAERTKDEEARRQVASERLRMARELHDVVAHHLTLVNAQSGVAEYLIRTDPAAAEKALHHLTEHTKLALDELRSTVGLLRQVDDTDEPREPGEDGTDERAALSPAPGLIDLPALVERHRSTPATVGLEVRGSSRPIPALTDLAAYRIIQEALTNARKHAPDADVEVRVEWQDDELLLSVTNGAPAAGVLRQSGPGTGHGLIGMRERASASHGLLTAGAVGSGGWMVLARFPLDRPSHDRDEESA